MNRQYTHHSLQTTPNVYAHESTVLSNAQRGRAKFFIHSILLLFLFFEINNFHTKLKIFRFRALTKKINKIKPYICETIIVL